MIPASTVSTACFSPAAPRVRQYAIIQFLFSRAKGVESHTLDAADTFRRFNPNRAARRVVLLPPRSALPVIRCGRTRCARSARVVIARHRYFQPTLASRRHWEHEPLQTDFLFTVRSDLEAAHLCQDAARRTAVDRGPTGAAVLSRPASRWTCGPERRF